MKRYLKLCAVPLVLLMGCSVLTHSSTSYDTDGPYINITQYEFETTVNNPIDFSNITGYDDVDGLLRVNVVGNIDYTKPGEYYPVLICVDTSGNETEAGIIVKVLEENQLPPDITPPENPDPQPDPEPTPSTCDSEDARDPGRPCKVVLSEDLEFYETLYIGETGEASCMKTEAYNNGTASCEPLFTNDGTFWGYGLIAAENAKKEESE